MLASSLLVASTLALPALASPLFAKREFAPYTDQITIHESCNATERRQLTKALADTMEVAQLAKNYIVANGPSDEVYQLYFGDGSYVTAMGVRLVCSHASTRGLTDDYPCLRLSGL